VERVGRSVRYYLTGGETLDSRTIRGSFQEAVAPLLSDKRFFLCGASFVLNLGHVKSVERGTAFLDGGVRAAVSRSAFSGLKQAWMDYWLEEEAT